ncbi:hypothetical protein [Roseateles depolymerans]|uniref:Uncharacterized protein n=1 Tax=Roseateles depolymerans TaxID=76731 RepID=A0A0U2U588_9BURK|nr:hypothetical protein [Roseateles depolymerans]ALV07201.1 hypothetical protein RD2015_2736 [Roseateles depolymerans]REG20184.1 hypothetical protein DES44_2691 [Roseateles depolymerans]
MTSPTVPGALHDPLAPEPEAPASTREIPIALKVIGALLLVIALAIPMLASAVPGGTAPPPRPLAIAPRGPAPAKAPVEAPAASAQAQVLDDGSDEAFRAQAEAAVLRKLGPVARREGARLMLFVEQGRPVMLDSRRPEPDDGGQTPYVDFRLDGISPDQGFYVVRVTLAFGSEVLWISRKNGQRYEMHGNVHPSPDGRYLVVTHASPGAEFNGVVVWALEGDRLVERYKFEATPEQRGVSFRFMRWRDASTIELEQFAEVDPSTCSTGTLSSLALLARKSERWILRSNSSPRCDA